MLFSRQLTYTFDIYLKLIYKKNHHIYTSSDSVMMDNKNKNKKKKQYRTKNKIKNECSFLYLRANTKDEKQTKQFLHYFTNSMQDMLLRELVVNDLAENIPDYNTKKI